MELLEAARAQAADTIVYTWKLNVSVNLFFQALPAYADHIDLNEEEGVCGGTHDDLVLRCKSKLLCCPSPETGVRRLLGAMGRAPHVIYLGPVTSPAACASAG